MKFIKLSQNKQTMIDDEDYEFLSQWKWHVKKSRGGFYASRSKREKDGRVSTIRMHRLLMNCPKGKEVDHINMDTLDNRKSNLEIVTVSENQKRAFNQLKNQNSLPDQPNDNIPF